MLDGADRHLGSLVNAARSAPDSIRRSRSAPRPWNQLSSVVPSPSLWSVLLVRLRHNPRTPGAAWRCGFAALRTWNGIEVSTRVGRNTWHKILRHSVDNTSYVPAARTRAHTDGTLSCLATCAAVPEPPRFSSPTFWSRSVRFATEDSILDAPLPLTLPLQAAMQGSSWLKSLSSLPSSVVTAASLAWTCRGCVRSALLLPSPQLTVCDG